MRPTIAPAALLLALFCTSLVAQTTFIDENWEGVTNPGHSTSPATATGLSIPGSGWTNDNHFTPARAGAAAAARTWTVVDNIGNTFADPAPAAVGNVWCQFGLSPFALNYSVATISPSFNAAGLSALQLDFTLVLDNYRAAAGAETFEVWYINNAGTAAWTRAQAFHFPAGDNSTTIQPSLDLSALAGSTSFRVAFVAQGADTRDIRNIIIDNISLVGSAAPINQPPVISVTRGGVPVANLARLDVFQGSTVADLDLEFTITDADSGDLVTLSVQVTDAADIDGFVNSQWNIQQGASPGVAAPTAGAFNTPGTITVQLDGSDNQGGATQFSFTLHVIEVSGSHLIQTRWDGLTLAGGEPSAVMFNIEVANDLEITELVMRFFAATTSDVSVYWRAGTYSGHESNIAAWTLHETVTGVVSGASGGMFGPPVAVPFTTPLPLPGGATYAIAILSDNDPQGPVYTEVGSVQTYSDANLELSLGAGVSNALKSTAAVWAPGVWNGAISYNLTGPVAPAITSTPVTAATAGAPYTYQVTATGTPAPTLSVAGIPAGSWLSFDPTTGILSGTPSPADAGNHGPITVTATNSQGSVDQAFTISVAFNNPPVLVVESAGTPVAQDQTLTVTLNSSVAGLALSFSATDPDADNVTIASTVTPAGNIAGYVQPEWNAPTPALNAGAAPTSGTFDTAGVIVVVTTAEDANGALATRRFFILVLDPLTSSTPPFAVAPAGSALTGSTGTGFTGTARVGEPLANMTLRLEDAEGDAIDVLVVTGAIPGVALPGTASGLPAGSIISFDGVPATAGTFAVTLIITDGLTAPVSFTVTLEVLPPSIGGLGGGKRGSGSGCVATGDWSSLLGLMALIAAASFAVSRRRRRA